MRIELGNRLLAVEETVKLDRPNPNKSYHWLARLVIPVPFTNMSIIGYKANN